MLRALKPLADQVIVVTGATSGVGLATARAAALRGAGLVLAARHAGPLRELADELRAIGARAEPVVADVSDPDQFREIVAAADAVFGGFDTWINDAGTGLYGRLDDTPVEEQKRLFDTDYWGVVHGSLIAAEQLKTRRTPGAIINIASILADQALPVQGAASAASHAVKGFTNALRMELLRSSPQVSVTLIKPSALDTPYALHARNFTGHKATLPPPVYDPALVAEAILYAAEHRTREVTVGGGGRAVALFGQLLPAVAEPLYAFLMPALTRGVGADHADRSHDTLDERAGNFPFVRRTSLWTRAQLNPEITAAVLAGAALGLWLTLGARRGLQFAHVRHKVRVHEREKYRAREAKLLARNQREGTRKPA